MIIDFHTHIFPHFFRNEREHYFSEEPSFEALYRSPKSTLVGRESLIEDMNKAGIQKSVIFGFPWEKEDYFRRHNDYILESVKKYPDRLIGFCCFSPRSSLGRKEAERCLKAGLSGVGELAFYDSNFAHNDVESLKDIMEVCSKFDVPIMLHTNEPVGHDYAGKIPMPLSQIYGLLKEYPSNRIVLAHWGGGLFFYGLMKKEVKKIFRNVWFDTAASPYLYRPDVYRIAGEIIGAEKILLGSDYPLLKAGRYLEEMASAKLSKKVIKKISGGNAVDLLGLS